MERAEGAERHTLPRTPRRHDSEHPHQRRPMVLHGQPGHQHIRAWSLADLRAFERATAETSAIALSDDEGDSSVRIRRSKKTRVLPGAWFVDGN